MMFLLQGGVPRLAALLLLLVFEGPSHARGVAAVLGTERKLIRKDAGALETTSAAGSLSSVFDSASNATSVELEGSGGNSSIHVAAKEAESCQLHPGKRLVLVTVDKDYLDFFENWLLFAEKHLSAEKQKVVVVPEDGSVTPGLRQLQMTPGGTERFEIKENMNTLVQIGDEDITNTTPWGSNGFSQLVNTRPRRLLYLLNKGCSVLYVDVDTVWLKDPFHDIDAAGQHDIYLTDDHGNPNAFQTHSCKNGDTWNFCTCFMYVRPTEHAKQLMQLWINEAERRKKFDQFALNQPEFNNVLCNSNSSYTMLPRKLYPSGEVFNIRGVDLEGPSAPAVVHANYRVGREAKQGFLDGKGLWQVERPSKEHKFVDLADDDDASSSSV